ncbi:MAG: glutamyl-tRNA reductase [Burkholderiaceae bacterium]
MELLALGLNHHTATLEVRERFAFAPSETVDALQALLRAGDGQIAEAAILSTCNRTEIYCAVDEPAAARHRLVAWRSSARALDPQAIERDAFMLAPAATVRHAFRVASGLDSMVLGETQILGQMKQAQRLAQQAGTLGPLLHQMLQRTFAVAKEVRHQTEIGAQSVSMAAACVRLAQRLFGDLSARSVLFVGAGEMIEVCAAHFAAQNPRRMLLANRTPAHARALAERLPAQAIPLAELPAHLPQADIVVSCTASTLPLIGLGMVESACKQRRHEPMFMVDLAVPRDIEPEVARLDDVFLYTVDDLANIVQEGREQRRAAVAAAETIIDRHTQAFSQWLEQRALVPLIRDVQDRVQMLGAQELDHARRMLARGEPAEAVLEQLAHRLTQKFLHGPLQTLQQADPAKQALLQRLLPQLFNLTPSVKPKDMP